MSANVYVIILHREGDNVKAVGDGRAGRGGDTLHHDTGRMFRSAKSSASGQDGCESHFHGNAKINEHANSDSDERAHTSAYGHPDEYSCSYFNQYFYAYANSHADTGAGANLRAYIYAYRHAHLGANASANCRAYISAYCSGRLPSKSGLRFVLGGGSGTRDQ